MEKIDTDWKTTKLKSLAKLFKPFNRDWTPLTSREKTSSVIQQQQKQETLNLNNCKKLWYVSIANISIINLHQLITCPWWQIMCSLVIQETLLSFIKSLCQYRSAVPVLSMLLSVAVAWRQFCCIVILLFSAVWLKPYTNRSCIGSSVVSFTDIATNISASQMAVKLEYKL